MSVSSQTRGSAVEQLVWCEQRITKLEAENERLQSYMKAIIAHHDKSPVPIDKHHARRMRNIAFEALAGEEKS